MFSSTGAFAAQIDKNDPRIQAFETGLVDRSDRDDPSARRWTIEERLAHHGVPGVGVAIIQDGEVVWSKGYGVKLAGQAAFINPETVFLLAQSAK